MIGIIVLSHGDFAKAAIKSSVLLAGSQPKIDGIGLYHGESPDDFRHNVEEKIATVDEGEGVLVLVDFYGGTPGNEAMKLISSYPIHIVSGLNLGMLLEVIVKRHDATLSELASVAVSSGLTTIMDVNERYQQVKTKKRK